MRVFEMHLLLQNQGLQAPTVFNACRDALRLDLHNYMLKTRATRMINSSKWWWDSVPDAMPGKPASKNSRIAHG